MSLKSSNLRIEPSAATDRRGWSVVASATVGMALGFGGLALLSVFMRPLEAEFGWTRSEISFAYAIATIGMAIGGLVWGRVSDKVDMRILLAVGGSGMVVSLLGLAAAHSLWQVYLANLVLGGFGFSMLYAPLLTATGEWFEHRRGLAVGIVTAGGAAGQGVFPFAANALIESLGWRSAFLVLGLVTLVALAIALPRVTRPAGVAAARASAQVQARPGGTETAQFVLLAAAAFMCCVCMGFPLVHLASFVGMVCGSPALGATSLLVAMLFGAVGRVCFGLIADRIGYLPSYAIASGLQTVCVVVYPLLGDSVSLLGLSAIFGFGFAGNMTCIVLCVRETVHPSRFGGALGMVMLVAWAGMGVGGYMGGVLFDAYLSYTLAFLLAGVAGLLNLGAIGLLVLIRRSAIPRAQCLSSVPA